MMVGLCQALDISLRNMITSKQLSTNYLAACVANVETCVLRPFMIVFYPFFSVVSYAE